MAGHKDENSAALLEETIFGTENGEIMPKDIVECPQALLNNKDLGRDQVRVNWQLLDTSKMAE